MAPSTTLQSRIDAFEKLLATGNQSVASSARPAAKDSPRTPPPNLLESPISPKAAYISSISPSTPPRNMPKPSTPPTYDLDREISLLDMKDWVVADGSPPRQNGRHLPNGSYKDAGMKPSRRGSDHSVPTPLISLDAPSPKTNHSIAPPLPPRQPSYASLKSVSSFASTRSGGMDNAPPSKLTSPSGSLTVEHTYPPLSRSNSSENDGNGKSHVPGSSISSFHSVSLSSDGDTPESSMSKATIRSAVSPSGEEDRRDEDDSFSLDESYENVSRSSAISPVTASTLAVNWEKAMARQKQIPPQLPQRPSSCKPDKSPPKTPVVEYPIRSTTSSAGSRRPPPPPPPPPTAYQRQIPSSARTSISDLSSIHSVGSRSSKATATPAAKILLSRATPVPVSARKRYEAIFATNVVQRRRLEKMRQKEKEVASSPRRTRQASGWRGLSVDLITSSLNSAAEMNKPVSDEDAVEENVGPDDVLSGSVVKMLWSASRLGRDKLKAIWNECDSAGSGSLNRDSFVKGMWRIDEELRKMRTTPQSTSLAALRSRRPAPKPAVTKLILR